MRFLVRRSLRDSSSWPQRLFFSTSHSGFSSIYCRASTPPRQKNFPALAVPATVVLPSAAPTSRFWSHRGMQPAAHWLSVRSRAPSPPVLTSFVSRAGGGGGLRSSTAPSEPVSTHLYRARITAQPQCCPLDHQVHTGHTSSRFVTHSSHFYGARITAHCHFYPARRRQHFCQSSA
eukprot:COSAG06_NODE_25595_length_633_cov_0.895131_1_plen_176_part_00